MKFLATLLAAVLGLSGCTHVISSAARTQADPALLVAELQRAPNAYTGKTLLLGGLIVANLADAEGSALELIPWNLDRFGEPLTYATADKRLVAVTEQCLDPERYAVGRLVTLSATATGRQHPVADGKDSGPELQIVEIYLWDTPYRYGLQPHSDPYLPEYLPTWFQRDNPYDPGSAPYPYRPTDLPYR